MRKLTFGYYPYPISDEASKAEKKIFVYSQVIPIIFVVLFFFVKIIEIAFGYDFSDYGVFPLRIKGLWGILFSPFIHKDFSHLISNAVPFYLLGTALFFFYRKHALTIFLINYFLCGILLWVGGREGWHIGASGVVYGLAVFLFFSGIYRNDIRLLTISLIIVFLYGGLFWGMFPLDPAISWEGHLLGAFSGFFLAFVYKHIGPPRKEYEWDEDEEVDDAYLEADEPDDEDKLI